MNKPMKLSLYALGIIVCLLVLLMAYLLLFFDVNDYKGKIEDTVQKQTGRELKINGRISLSLFPWLGLEVDDLSLGNAKGFEDPHMARFHKALFKVKLLPLFTGDIHVGTLQLKEFQVHLARNNKGVPNREDLIRNARKGPGEKQPAEPEAKTGPAELAGLSIEQIQFKQGELTWEDNTTETRAEVRDLDLVLGPIQPGTPSPLELSAIVSSNRPEISRAEVNCSGEISLELDKRIITLDGFRIKTDARGPGIPGGKAEFSLSSAARLDLSEQTLKVQELKAGTYNLALEGDMTGTGLFETPKIQGTISLKEFNPKALLQELEQPPLRTSDPEALTACSARLEFSSTMDRIGISDLQASLDGSSIKGTGRIADLKNPQIAFTLQMDRLNVDRYLPPKAKEDGKEQGAEEEPARKDRKPKEEAGTAAVGLPPAFLRDLALKGEVDIGSLTVHKMNLDRVKLRIRADDGIIRLDPLTAELYKGKIKNTTRVDVRTETPAIQTSTNLNSIVIEPLLLDLIGRKTLSGTGGVQADLNFQGLTGQEILRSLGGDLSLSLEKGSLRGVNIPGLIRKTQAMLQGGQTAENGDRETDFSSFKATAKMQQGRISQSTLELLSPLCRVKGKGQVDLLKKFLDYDLQVHILKGISGEHQDLANLSGSSIPLKIKGDLDNPDYTLDLEAVLQDRLQEKGEKILDKELDKLREKLNTDQSESDQKTDEALDPGKLLKGLFN